MMWFAPPPLSVVKATTPLVPNNADACKNCGKNTLSDPGFIVRDERTGDRRGVCGSCWKGRKESCIRALEAFMRGRP
jgi:hypothetical protein